MLVKEILPVATRELRMQIHMCEKHMLPHEVCCACCASSLVCVAVDYCNIILLLNTKNAYR